MARPFPARFPLWMVLLLLLCLSCLAVHLYAESLDRSGFSSAFALAEKAGHYDDHFVISPLLISQPDDLLVNVDPVTPLSLIVFGLPPLVPPPNC